MGLTLAIRANTVVNLPGDVVTVGTVTATCTTPGVNLATAGSG